MTADMKGQLRPTLYRFKLGDFEVMTILDSFAVRDGLGSVHAGGSKPGEIEELAKKNNIDPSKFEHPFVPVLVNTGKQVILFDTGNGTLAKDNEALKGRVPDGHLVERMGQAGYKPEDVDIVAITHCHPDHIGGNFTGGKPTFPNARYVIAAAEFDYWKKGEGISEARKPTKFQFDKIMAPLADKCTFLKGGDEVVSGVRAVDCSGHSAGLTGFQIESGGKSVLLVRRFIPALRLRHSAPGLDHRLRRRPAEGRRQPQENAGDALRREADGDRLPHAVPLDRLDRQDDRRRPPLGGGELSDECVSRAAAHLFLKSGLPLVDEGLHAFLLILRREQRVEDAALEADALGERHLERAQDRLLRQQH